MDSGDLYWDPYDTRFADNPWPVFNRIREQAPLYYNEPHDFYALSRYADVERALTDWETYSSTRGDILELIKANIEMPPGTLIMEDPPAHNIHRQLLAGVFSPRRIRDLEPLVREYCVRCLDPLVGECRFDLIEKLGLEMPMRVIGMLMGIPEDSQAVFRDRSNAHITADDGKMEVGFLSYEAFGEYIDWRTAHPSDDVMTELLTKRFEDENGVTRTLTRDEIMTYVTVLTSAGNETTGRLIGWMGSTLARHPRQRAELAADPSLIPGAVEEVLRLEPPGAAIARYVKKPVELYGQVVPAGSAMMLLLGAANRDPERYDDPERFDIHRKKGMHLTFNVGPHYCLGSALARLEGRIALEELLRRWPSWEVDWDEAKFQQTSTVRGWERLPLLVG
ncbi:MAG TPA: cytochrome P450 [Streptosporangiaceae bacterium]|nr:cytochrome P450 [Streptosporangiaceae bacterium]